MGESVSDGELTEGDAEELLYDAIMNLDRVRRDYPNLTQELDDIARYSRTGLSFLYFRMGREEQRPTLTEQAKRDIKMNQER